MQVKDNTVSGTHGRFKIVDKKLTYEDLGSTNGSFNIHGGSVLS
jgi:pSer/pThr/pTyr-binding forkhead associated (FHA) protein